MSIVKHFAERLAEEKDNISKDPSCALARIVDLDSVCAGYCNCNCKDCLVDSILKVIDIINTEYFPKPLYEDGTPVNFGDEVEDIAIDEFVYDSDGMTRVTDKNSFRFRYVNPDKAIKRPRVIGDREGVGIAVGDEVYDTAVNTPWVPREVIFVDYSTGKVEFKYKDAYGTKVDYTLYSHEAKHRITHIPTFEPTSFDGDRLHLGAKVRFLDDSDNWYSVRCFKYQPNEKAVVKLGFTKEGVALKNISTKGEYLTTLLADNSIKLARDSGLTAVDYCELYLGKESTSSMTVAEVREFMNKDLAARQERLSESK